MLIKFSMMFRMVLQNGHVVSFHEMRLKGLRTSPHLNLSKISLQTAAKMFVYHKMEFYCLITEMFKVSLVNAVNSECGREKKAHKQIIVLEFT